MTKGELVNMVRTVLNEHGEDLAFSVADDNVKLNDYIDRALLDAVTGLAVEGRAINPVSTVLTSSADVYSLPNDFVSLVKAKCRDWACVATRIVEPTEAEYRRALNTHTAPGKNAPKCLRDGINTIKFLPVGTLTEFIYNASLGETFNGSERACKAVVYMAAALVCSFFEDTAGMQRFMELSKLYV